MTVVLESEVTILDPHFTTAAITRTFGLHVFDTLFAMNEKGEIKPQMVGDYQGSPDGLTWTFKLRENVKSNYGNTMTADDVKWSYEYQTRTGELKDKKLQPGQFAWMFEGLEEDAETRRMVAAGTSQIFAAHSGV